MLVRNPVNPRQVSRVSLSPEVVDGFVFWTKNPAPMIPWLDKLPDCPYYFQVTLTPYDEQIERYLPSKRKVILPAVRQLARQIGPERVVWRYDPVFLTERYSVDFHKKAFAQIARLLRGNTVRCVISFLDWYPPMEKRLRPRTGCGRERNADFYLRRNGRPVRLWCGTWMLYRPRPAGADWRPPPLRRKGSKPARGLWMCAERRYWRIRYLPGRLSVLLC